MTASTSRPRARASRRGAAARLRSASLRAALLLGYPIAVAAQEPELVQPYDPADCPPCAAWTEPHRPVHLFGNTFYVGTKGLGSILIASPDGHVLIDGGLPDSAPLILANIRALGFDPGDVEIILNSHAHYDHAGGIAALQDVTGGRVLASESSADVLERGTVGPDDPQHGVALPMHPVAGVRVVRDGEVVRVGALALTMHATGGHTPGGTSWSWRACEGDRCLSFVYADSQTPVSADGFRFSDSVAYPDAVSDFRRGHDLLERIPCDVLVTPHPGASAFWDRAASAPEDLIDPGACRRYVARSRRQLQDRLDRERP